MKYLITLDLGTTSVKTSIYDHNLRLVSHFNEEYQLIAESNNIIELEAETYWNAVKNGIKNACAMGGVDGGDIYSVTVTTQGETLIPVDREGVALRNAIVWLDGRAAKESKYISGKFSAQEFYSVTGVPECTGFCPVSKLLWIKNNEPEIYEKTDKFMLLEDYVIMRLTGKFVSEKSLLSTTGYFDIVSDSIWQEMLDFIQIDADKIPEAMECGRVVAEITSFAAREIGLSPKTLVTTGAMDQTAAAVGAGNIVPGIITETTGTALGIAATTNNPDLMFLTKLSVA